MFQFLALSSLALVSAGNQPDKPPVKEQPAALLAKGQFQEVVKPLQQIFQFQFEEGKLQVNRTAWGKGPKEIDPKAMRFGSSFNNGPPVEKLFWQVQSISGGGGRSASFSSRRRRVSFSGTKMSGRMYTSGDIVRMSLEEGQGPRRTLQFTTDGPKKGFSLQVDHPSGDMIVLRQTEAGRFVAVALKGDQTFAAQGQSFVDFYRRHSKLMESDIVPAMKHFGIEFILPYHPHVRKAVVGLLSRTPETLAQGKQLIADLDSNEFAKRQNAAKLLSGRFQIYQDLITERLKQKPSLETRTRLERIVADHANAQEVRKAIESFQLLKDAAYLVALFENAGPDDIKGIVGQLEKTTGKKLGSDPAAWRKWLKERKKEEGRRMKDEG